MEVKMNQILKTLDGKPFPSTSSPFLVDVNGDFILTPEGRQQFDPKHIISLTLGDVCLAVLQAGFEDEKNLALDKKTARWKLAQKIYNVTTVDLAAEEITLLKELIPKGWGITIIGRAFEMLDPVKK